MTKIVTFLAVVIVGGAVVGAAIFAGIASANFAESAHNPFSKRSHPLTARVMANSVDDAPLDKPQLTLFPYNNNKKQPLVNLDKGYLRLAFNFSITETCSDNSVTTATGIYTNGNLIYNMSLPAGHRVAIDHGDPDFPALIAGPYLYDHGEMEFAYNGWQKCAWDEGNQDDAVCGECVVGGWEAAWVEWQCPRNMSTQTVQNRDETRHKNLMCSFILGPAPAQGSSTTTTPPLNTPTPDVHLLPGHTSNSDINITHHTDGNFDTTSFTFSLTEECIPHDTPHIPGVGMPSWYPQAKAFLTSDTRIVHLPLLSNATVPIQLSSDLPPLNVGPYNFNISTVPFNYNGTGTGCTWYPYDARIASDQGYKCGWCNSAEWSGRALDCKPDSVASRTRDMKCEVAIHKGS